MMNSSKHIVAYSLVIGIILLQIVYLLTIYKKEQYKIESTLLEIETNYLESSRLEKELAHMPSIMEQIDSLKIEQENVLSQIPTMQTSTQDIIALTTYLESCDFLDKEMALTMQEEPITVGTKIVYKREYTMNFIGVYEEVRNLIDYLNESCKLAEIAQFSVSNEIQEQEIQKETLIKHYKERFYDLVSVHMQLNYYIREEEKNEELLIALEESKEKVDAFKKLNIAKEEVKLTIDNEAERDLFKLDIGDILSSGDTYKLLGPGDGDDYIGLSSNVNTVVQIIINENQYSLAIQDANGNIKELKVDEKVESPYLTIDSSLRQIQEVMPNIKINIENYTQHILEIEMSGTLLDNIYIYSGIEPVLKGQQKGNVKLI